MYFQHKTNIVQNNSPILHTQVPSIYAAEKASLLTHNIPLYVLLPTHRVVEDWHSVKGVAVGMGVFNMGLS